MASWFALKKDREQRLYDAQQDVARWERQTLDRIYTGLLGTLSTAIEQLVISWPDETTLDQWHPPKRILAKLDPCYRDISTKLTLLIAHHPDPESQRYSELMEIYSEELFIDPGTHPLQIIRLREVVLATMLSDPRIHSVARDLNVNTELLERIREHLYERAQKRAEQE
jgi:hypothetical protein